MSSLSSQLQNIASLDASRLISRGGHPSSKSYLFPPKVAAFHDLDAIFSLAQSGFEEIASLDPGLEQFEDDLFSERAKTTDRMMLNLEENARLDVILGRCLRRLGKWVGVMAGGKCIEWLVRRFRVHEMNAETLLQVFLPYHSSPNFARILAILTIPTDSPYYAPFAPLVKKAQPIPRSYITAAIVPEREKSLRLLGDVMGMIKVALKEGVVHRALVAFWTGTFVELVEKSRAGKSVGEGLVKTLVEVFVDAMSTKDGGIEINAAVYPPLILLTRSIRLADEPLHAILSALLTPNNGADPSHRVLTLLVILDERPGWTSGLGENGSTHLAEIQKLGKILVTAMGKYDFKEAVKVISEVMLDQADANKDHLRAIVESSVLSPSLVKVLAVKALLVGSSPDSPQSSKHICKSILTSLRERHPAIVDAASLENPSIDSTLVEKSSDEMALVNLHAADLSARVEGVIATMALLLKEGETTTIDKDDLEAVRAALLSRLSDVGIPVLKALYATNNHKALLCTLFNEETLINAIAPAFTTPTLDDAAVQLHLNFAGNHLAEKQPMMVFERIIFPVLLKTGDRYLSPETWEVLLNSPICNWDVLKTALAKANNTGDISAMSAFDLAAKMASAIQTSDNYEHLITFLVSQLDTELPSSRLLAHLILIQLVLSIRGDHQISLAIQVLQRVRHMLRGDRLQDFEDTTNPLSPKLAKAIANKPGSKRTGQRATIALLAALSSMVRPSNLQVNWLSNKAETTGDRSGKFQIFAQSIYTWSNSDVLPQQLSQALLRYLFAQLGEDALLFLASIWTSSSTETGTALRLASLRHATAFVRAHTGIDADQRTDFQLVVPAVLVAISNDEKVVREAATVLLKAITSAVHGGSSNVYALDAIYGPQSSTVQLLKQSDMERYLRGLTTVSSELVVDATRLAVVHATMLGLKQGESKKDAANRRAVITSLLSHVIAWRNYNPRLAILSSLANVQDSSLFRGVLPLLSAVLDANSSESRWVADLLDKQQSTYLKMLFATINTRSAASLADSEGESWKFVKAVVLGGATPLASLMRRLLLARMDAGVFDVLAQAHKSEVFIDLIISLSSSSTDDMMASKGVLSILQLDPSTFIDIAQSLSQPLEMSGHRKRQKRDESAEQDKTEQAITHLTALVESRDWKIIPGDAPLVATLMTVLSTLLAKRQSVKEGIDYLEQEILGAILAVVSKIQEPAEIQRAHVGVEVIIKVIRASTNPRTCQRALLVASELARLIPEAILHNVMPIFTFMGASDFQRDDAYSFGVVEKTVSRIVPVMTKSLKDKASSKLELYHESKTFLNIFTDMAGRLPKHRTLPFFVHLVKSLGADDFLAPIAMLLVDRSTSKTGRGGISAAQAMELPQGVTGMFNTDIRLDVVLEVVSETIRLVTDLSLDENQTAFLNHLHLETDSDRSDRVSKQTTALLSFASHIARQVVEKSCDQSVIEEIVKQLVLLAANVSTTTLSSTGVPAVVQSVLGAGMQLLSAERFLKVILKLLAGEADQDLVIALNIFVERLPRVKAETRTNNATAMTEILKQTSSLVSPTSTINSPALSALYAVTSTAQKSESAALAATVPHLLEVAAKLPQASDQITTLSLIDATARHLESRMIPFIQPITETTLSMIASSRSTPSVVGQAFIVQSALFETVPTFIGSKQLHSLLRCSIGYRVTDAEVSRKVLSTAAKEIPTKTMFPVVMELWKSIQGEGHEVLTGFFGLLRMVLRNADRNALPTLVKPLFAFFLDVFDLRHRLRQKRIDSEAIDAIEESSIGSFLELVTKMNESTFKPLFIRLFDWAVIDLSEGKAIDDARLVERKMVLLHIMAGLLQKFKNLLSPYIGTLLPHIDELLTAFANGEILDRGLWTLVLSVLKKSFEVDDGAYWTDASCVKLIPLLISQIFIFTDLTSVPESPIAQTLAAMASSTTSEPVLKKLNTSICLLTRGDDPRERMSALRALDGIWEKQADELLQFVPETVGEFLAELLEDENSDVERMARGILARIEKITGSLKEYLE